MNTIIELFETSVAKYPNNTFLKEKTKGQYRSITFTECRHLVHRFAAGLMAMGIQKGDRIALISEGRADWPVSELGILFAGAIDVPLSVKIDETAELKFRLEHSGCRMVIASRNQSKKVAPIIDEISTIEKLILLDEVENVSHKQIFFSEINKLGEQYIKSNASDFEARYKNIIGSDAANICYTSGTTADPKGIILTHRNYVANVEQANSLMPVPEWYCTLLILPWDHAFAHTAGIFTVMSNGASIASVETGATPMETLKNIPINIKEIQPSFLLSVPALAKNFKKNIEAAIRRKGGLAKFLFNTGLKAAYAYNREGINKGQGFQLFNKIMYSVADKLVFSKIRENFGGKLEFFIGGGALLDIDLQRFFYAIGMPMFQGYGLTESAPIISSNSLSKHKLGSSGYLVNNLELKICDDNGNELPIGSKGEIVVRGDNVMAGYWNNEKATADTIKNGWLHTGDLGYMDSDGFLYVLGRFKSLLISNDGEKFSPEGIEEAMVEKSRYIDQCMLYNNQNAYTVALIVPNQGPILFHLRELGLAVDSEEGQKAALKKIQEEIDLFKTGGKFGDMFPQRWLPSAVAILDEAFTEQNHMLNTTLKMVRPKITAHYKSRIEFLYTAEGKNIFNAHNIESVSKFKS